MIALILKIFSTLLISFLIYKLIIMQKEHKTRPRQKMINFLLMGIIVILMEMVESAFNTETYIVLVSFQHITLFTTSMLYALMLDWAIALKAATVSYGVLELIEKKSIKFIMVPFAINLIFMFLSFTFLNRVTDDIHFIFFGYSIITYFFKINYLFLTLLSFLFFPNIKNLIYLKKALFFMVLARAFNLICYVVNTNDTNDFMKYIFVFPAAILGAIGFSKLLKDKKKSCEKSQLSDTSCKDD